MQFIDAVKAWYIVTLGLLLQFNTSYVHTNLALFGTTANKYTNIHSS
jgi:hypothetical protein